MWLHHCGRPSMRSNDPNGFRPIIGPASRDLCRTVTDRHWQSLVFSPRSGEAYSCGRKPNGIYFSCRRVFPKLAQALGVRSRDSKSVIRTSWPAPGLVSEKPRYGCPKAFTLFRARVEIEMVYDFKFRGATAGMLSSLLDSGFAQLQNLRVGLGKRQQVFDG